MGHLSAYKQVRTLAPMIQRPLRWSGARDLLSSPRKDYYSCFRCLTQ